MFSVVVLPSITHPTLILHATRTDPGDVTAGQGAPGAAAVASLCLELSDQAAVPEPERATDPGYVSRKIIK